MSQSRVDEMAEGSRAMTHEELAALPVSFSLEVANRALSLGRSTGYALAKRGQYPIRVLRLGRQYRCTRYDLLRYLRDDDQDDEPAAA